MELNREGRVQGSGEKGHLCPNGSPGFPQAEMGESGQGRGTTLSNGLKAGQTHAWSLTPLWERWHRRARGGAAR